MIRDANSAPRSVIGSALIALLLPLQESHGDFGVFCYRVGWQLWTRRRGPSAMESAAPCSTLLNTSSNISTTSRD